MKKLHFAYSILGLLALYVFTTSSSLGRATDDNVGNTGAPGENQLCSNCHNNGSYGTVNASIQVFETGTTNPVSFYIPNTLYDLRVTVTGSMGSPLGYGFQLTTMTGTNTPYAAYSNLASNVKQKAITTGAQAGRTYLEHNGVLNNNQFNFKWTSPSSGNVTFYASGVACNTNGGSGGDRAGNSNLSLPMAPNLSVSSAVTPISCFNANDGAIAVTINSGVSPYTFVWSDGSTAATRSNLSPGSYSVTVTDQLGQTFEETFTLTNPQPLTADVLVTQPEVVGDQGSIELFISGGNSPYTWSFNGGPANTYPELFAGSYTLNVLDANGCEASDTFEIVDPEGIQAIVTVTDVSCFGLNDGQIDLNINGGTAPYEVVWQNQTGITPEGYAAGTYTALISDAVGNQTQVQATVGQPEPVLITSAFAPIACFGGTTEVTVTASGGTAPYTGIGVFAASAGEQNFTVTDAQGCTYSTFVTLEQPAAFVGDSLNAEMSCTGGDIVLQVTASGGVEPYVGKGEIHFENPGTYTLPLTDANGCSTSAVITIAAIDGPSLTSTVNSPTCWGLCDGSIALNAGDAEGQFVWSDDATGAVREALCAGAYTCTFTGTDGCVLVNSFTLNAPDSLVLIVNAPDSICVEQTAVASATAVGGTAPYALSWSNGDTGASAELVAGIHVVSVEDANGCASQAELAIAIFPTINIIASTSVAPTCFGLSNGSIAIDASSASGIAVYTWTPNVSTSAEATALFAGQYTIEVTNGSGCLASLTLPLDEPSALHANVTIDENQNGEGTITANPSGGTPPYSIAWSNGSTDNSIDVPTGFYSVIITDAAGCTEESVGLEIVSSVLEEPRVMANGYPNPFDHTLHLVVQGQYIITNALGERYSEGAGNSTLDTSTWPSGVYFIQNENNSPIRLIKY